MRLFFILHMILAVKETCSANPNKNFVIFTTQKTETDKRSLAARGSVPIGIGKDSHIKRSIIDKNARIGDNVKVLTRHKTP